MSTQFCSFRLLVKEVQLYSEVKSCFLAKMAIVVFVFSNFLGCIQINIDVRAHGKRKIIALFLPKTLFQLLGLQRPKTLAKITILAVFQTNILKSNLHDVARGLKL